MLSYDALTADRENLYDGTLGGTIKALSGRLSLTSFKASADGGLLGFNALNTEEVKAGLMFRYALERYLQVTELEKSFLARSVANSEEESLRRGLVLYSALRRKHEV